MSLDNTTSSAENHAELVKKKIVDPATPHPTS
jgi:hypothetical protein